MAGKIAGYRKPTGSELRAQRIAREVGPTPAEEARQREERMLASLGTARDDFEWIAANRGWLLLGHSTCMEWWRDRIQPAADGLMLRPAPDVAKRVIGLIQQEQAELPPAQRSSKKELAQVVGASDWVSRGRRQDPSKRRPAAGNDLDGPTVIDLQPSSVTDEKPLDPEPADIAAALTQAIKETAAHTSAAGPAATTGGAFPPAGETGPEPDGTGLGSGPQNSPAAESASSPHAGVPAAGALGCPLCPFLVGMSEVDPDAVVDEMNQHLGREHDLSGEAAHDAWLRVLTISPAAATTSLPDGGGDPMPEQSQQPGQDSPPVLGSEGFPGRAETDHQRVTGVSPAGEAPGYQDPVEPVELEDGDNASLSSSSSDPVLMAFAALLILIRQVDVEALGPKLFDEEMALLDQHVDDIALFVAKLGKARFAEMLHTP